MAVSFSVIPMNSEFSEEICGLIPFYNNAKTVDATAEKTLKYLRHCILVDDGSTDGGAETLRDRPGQVLLKHTANQGKGAAVMTGAKYALQHGFKYVLQIDADAQHNPDDIPEFLSTLRENPGTVIIGYREFDHTTPKSSRFGRWFGTLWFRIETLGVPIKDTQCGFRIYPAPIFNTLDIRCSRMDFDVEILILAAQHGIKIIEIPIQVRYFTGDDRVTHFRPLQDNWLMAKLHFKKTWALCIHWPALLENRRQYQSRRETRG